MRQEKISIKWKIFLYLLTFAGILLLVLWLIQICYLDTFYKKIKTRYAEKIISETIAILRSGEEDAEEKIDELAAENNVAVFVTDMEGNAVTSEVFSKSKLTMINVWATYCSPCLNEMPELGELAAEYDSADFQLLGIVSDVMEGQEENIGYAAELIEETGAEYPHLLLNESLYYGLLSDVSAVPTTFFLNEQGQVLDVVVGAMDKSGWKEKIDGLLETL